MAEPKVKAPKTPIEQGGAQDGLPQPTQRAVNKLRIRLAPATASKRIVSNPNVLLGGDFDDETTRIATDLASRGITNPTLEDLEEARGRLGLQEATIGLPIPPLSALGEFGVTPHTRDVLQAAGTTTTGPSRQQVEAIGQQVQPPVEEKKPPKPFDYKLDLPKNYEEAIQVLNYRPPEFQGINAALDVNDRPIEGEWVDAKGKHLDPILEQQYEDYLLKLDIARQVFDDHLAFIERQLEAEAAAGRGETAAAAQAQRDIDVFKAQEGYRAQNAADAAELDRRHDSEQRDLDRALKAGDLDEVIRHNEALEELDKERFGLERTGVAFSILAAISANPAMLFFLKQSGLFGTLIDQFGFDLSMFDSVGPTSTLPFTLSDLARMSPSERKLAIGRVQAATGQSEADIMDALRRAAPGSGQGRPQRTTV